ncbi:MAG TPA: MBL fold metallo-hydrolase [Bacteroidales bacterium]|nr:MBL fold metallo-hydrolase [Bacteroidales bacterium]
MAGIKTFTFNAFQVNTYIVFDETRNCLIIDPGCYEKHEQKQLADFIKKEELNVRGVLYTHGHIDHILGNNFVIEQYGTITQIHRDSLPFLHGSREYGKVFGFETDEPALPAKFIEEGDTIAYGNRQLIAIHTPGHAAGSLCFYNEKESLVIVGDVLFSSSIGRTDLPTGDYDLLITSINEKLLSLPDHVKVYPGHGPATTIGQERRHNPFLNNLH